MTMPANAFAAVLFRAAPNALLSAEGCKQITQKNQINNFGPAEPSLQCVTIIIVIAVGRHSSVPHTKPASCCKLLGSLLADGDT